MVLFYEIEWEEVHCSCGYRIPSDWLKKTVDEIQEQLIRDEIERVVCTTLVTKEDPSIRSNLIRTHVQVVPILVCVICCYMIKLTVHV